MPASHRCIASLASIVAVLAPAGARANSWTWLSPTPSGFSVNAMDFPTTGKGFFVGAQGTILVSTDSGATFQSQAAPTQADLFGVFFLSDGLTGWAVGDGGVVLHTADGGAHWTQQTSGTGERLYAVAFTDSLHGFCAGEERTLLQTADGGQTWTGRDGQLLNLNALVFPDAQHGFAAGWGGNVLVTIDGGASWTSVFTGLPEDLLALAFVDDNHGWAVGASGTIVKTADGGHSWVAQAAGVTTQDLVGVIAVSATLAYAVGDGGAFLYTTDGTTWIDGNGVFGDTLTSLAIDGTGTVWTAGTDGHVYQGFASSTPGQLYFADENRGIFSSESVTGLAFSDPQHGVIAAGFLLYYTSNGGTTLQIANVPPPPGDGGIFFSPNWQAVAMPSATLAIAVGSGGSIVTSVNGGQDWTWLTSGNVSDLYAVTFVDAKHGWAAGSNDTILSTANGGQTWLSTTAPAAGVLRTLYFIDQTHGFAGGDYGALVATTDGLNWRSTSAQFETDAIFAIGGVPPGLLYAVGQAGYVLASPDQGTTWFQQLAPVNADLHGLVFLDRLNGFMVTSKPGLILVTRDGGQTWSTQLHGIPGLSALAFTDLNHGFAGGAGGALLGTVTGGESDCTAASDCPGNDGGEVGYSCQSGACTPCNIQSSCTTSCTPCGGVVPYCMGDFCGQCRDTADCTDGGTCIAGGCVINTPFDGGPSEPDAGSDGGTGGKPDAGGEKVVTILPDGGIVINPAALCCSCASGGPGTVPALLLLVAGVTFLRARARRGRSRL